MRSLSLLFLAALIVGCGDADGEVSTARSVSMDDQRYALSLYATPTMTYSAAKSCYQLAKIGEAEIKKTPGIMGRIFGEHFKPYWKFLVDIGSESGASKKDVFVSGKFVESEIEPSLVLTGGISARSEQCGFVMGQMLAHSGFVNIGDIIEVEDSTDDLSFSSDEALGMYILGLAADEVFASNEEIVVECAAIMRANLPHGDEPDANYFVWLSSLSDILSEGKVKPSLLADRSEIFNLLVKGKGDSALALKAIDGDMTANCVDIASSAIAKAKAGVPE